jgi:hypothetical protein
MTLGPSPVSSVRFQAAATTGKVIFYIEEDGPDGHPPGPRAGVVRYAQATPRDVAGIQWWQ